MHTHAHTHTHTHPHTHTHTHTFMYPLTGKLQQTHIHPLQTLGNSVLSLTHTHTHTHTCTSTHTPPQEKNIVCSQHQTPSSPLLCLTLSPSPCPPSSSLPLQ